MRARKRSIAKRLPGQVYAHEGQRFLFYDAEVTLSHERAEMLPDRPWALGGGLCDLAALSTPSDRDYIASHGVSRDRLHVIGDLSLDSVHAAWRQRDAIVSRLRERYFGGRRTRPLVIMAVTQFAEQGLATREAADRAAREMVAPAAAVADVLVSLHPKSRSADYTFLDREFGARIAAEPLHAILPAADLFVAGYSSTVRWAVLTRTPAIVADLGWWGYDLYDDFAGVVTVRDRAAYARTLAELIADPDRRAALAAAHADKAASMGSFDGCAGRRLIELLDGLF